MKKLLYLACIACAAIILASCKKDEEPKLGSLYGVVTDKATGDPIRSAGVELLPKGLKSVTGDDGSFEFSNIEEGTYKLYITKNGYKDFTSNGISVKADSKNQSSLQIEKLPPALTVVDDNRKVLDSIDFSSDGGVTMQSFNLFNNSESKLEWSITYDCKWIKSFSKTEGNLDANGIQPIVCTIDRNKLNLGDNTTIAHIISNNGSKQLKIMAKSVDVVETLEATGTGSHATTLHGKIIRNLDPAITEYGFVYSKNETPTLSNGAQKISNAGSPQIGAYSMKVEGLAKQTSYYVRAFVTNGEAIIYGDQVSFTTISYMPEITLKGEPQVTATAITITYTVSDGGLPIEEVGVCWSKESVPSKENNYQKAGTDAKQYTTTIIGLNPSTTYYVKIYARNGEEEVYGSLLTIKTDNGLPKVETIDPDDEVTSTSVTAIGNIVDDCGYEIIERGFVYNTLPYPTLDNSTNISSGAGVGFFSATITGITPASNTYYIRAYAKNANGTAYGDQVVITPERVDYATLTTLNHGGYTYKIKPLGEMSWYDGNEACNNMVYGGYDDWFMPNEGVVKDILILKKVWDTSNSISALKIFNLSSIWTSDYLDNTRHIYYAIYTPTGNDPKYSEWGRVPNYYGHSDTKLYGVIAVRRYRTDN